MQSAAHFTDSELGNPCRATAIAFDMDASTLASLGKSLPGWHIDPFVGTTVASLPINWDPGQVELFVVHLHQNVSEVLGLCRFLAKWPTSSHDVEQFTNTRGMSGLDELRRVEVPVLVFVTRGDTTLVGAALEAGARACFQLPISAIDVARLLEELNVADALMLTEVLPALETLRSNAMQQKNLVVIAMAERCLNIIQKKPEDVRFALPESLCPDHLRWMCKTIVKHAEDWPDTKSHRWIGYVQAGMIANLMLNIGTARSMFKELHEQFGALSNDQDLLDHLDPNTSFEIETGGQG